MPSKKSFLPEDYVRDARERRSGLFALALFVIVMGAVFSAFLVTNRQWAAVRSAQVSINDETEKAAKEINEMKRLEAMRASSAFSIICARIASRRFISLISFAAFSVSSLIETCAARTADHWRLVTRNAEKTAPMTITNIAIANNPLRRSRASRT